MLEGFAENARRAIFFARYEAAQLGSSEIAPEHVLLGLLKSDPNLASKVEVIVGASAEEIRHEVLAYLPPHGELSPPAHMVLSQKSRQMFDVAREESNRVSGSKVTNCHILLALLLIEQCFAGQLLRRRGLSVDNLRKDILALREGTTEKLPSQTVLAAGNVSSIDRRLCELESQVLESFRLNDYQAALRLVDDAITDPTLDRNKVMWSLVPIASVIARNIGNIDLAARYCKLRLAYDPDNAMALYTLADCLARQGKNEDAKEIARKSRKLSLGNGAVKGRGLAELVEQRFPESKSEQ